MDQKPKAIRVVLADDHPDVIAALRRFLSPFVSLVGSVDDGRVLLETVGRLSPYVVVVDLNMPHVDGIQVSRRIRESMPEVSIVLLTADDDTEVRTYALRLGVSAVVLKQRLVDDLIPAIEAACGVQLASHP